MYIYLYIYNSKYYTNKETIRTTSWGVCPSPGNNKPRFFGNS